MAPVSEVLNIDCLNLTKKVFTRNVCAVIKITSLIGQAVLVVSLINTFPCFDVIASCHLLHEGYRKSNRLSVRGFKSNLLGFPELLNDLCSHLVVF